MGSELPENVNTAAQVDFLLSSMEPVPDVSAMLKAPNRKEEKSEDVVKETENARVWSWFIEQQSNDETKFVGHL